MRSDSPYTWEPLLLNEADMFYGYQSELEDIVSKAIARRRYSFLIVGGSRMGKTTLLRQVERRLRALQIEHEDNSYQPFVLPIFIDMLQLSDASLNDFLGKIARLLNDRLSHSSFNIPDKIKISLQSIKTHSEPVELFTNILKELSQVVEPRQLRVVLLIDDLWRPKQQKPEVSTTLRALYVEPLLEETIAYVITGNYSESETASQGDSPFYNILVNKLLHVFDREQSLALINGPTHNQLPAEVAEKVYIETGGHPFLIHLLMSRLCDEHSDLRQLSIGDVVSVTEYQFSEHQEFERWWGKLRDEEQRVYEAICRNDQVSLEDLRRMMLNIPREGGRSIIITVPMLRNALRVLRTTGLIRESELPRAETLYETTSEWFKRWFTLTYKNPTQSLR